MMRALPIILGMLLMLSGCGGGGGGDVSNSNGGSPTVVLSGNTVPSLIALGADSVTPNAITKAASVSFPVVNATVTLYDVATGVPACRSGVGITDTGGGKIQIDTACLHDLNVIKATGGQVSATPVLGALHAILTRDQLLSGRSNITALTEAFYESYGYMAAAHYSVAEVSAALDRSAQAVVTQDISQDGTISYDDIVQWQPNLGETMLLKRLTAANNSILQGIALPQAALPTSAIFSAVNFSSLANDTTVDVALSGTTAYLLNSSRNLFIADVSNKSAPALLGQLDLCSNTPTGQPCNSAFNAIALANQSAVVVGSQLQMVDVSSPSFLTLSGSLQFPGVLPNMPPGVAQDVTVVGSIAYVAVSAVSTESLGGLVIVNIANPSNPVMLGQLTVKGRSARGVRVVGERAYLANGYDGLQIVDVTNPAAPVQLGAVAFTSVYAQADDVEVVGSIAYVATGLGGIQVVSLATPSNPSVLNTIATAGQPRRLAIQNNVLYAADGAGGLLLMDLPSPGSLALRTRIATNSGTGDAVALTVGGGTAYVAYGSDGLVLMDTSITKDPTIVADLSIDGAKTIAGSGNALIVSTSTLGVAQPPLQVVNIMDPLHPVLSTPIPILGGANDLQIVGGVAYLANSPWGLQTVDLASGRILSQSTEVLGGPAVGLAVAGDRAFLANRDGFVVADISNPSAPSIIGGISTKKDARRLIVDGTVAYVAEGQDGIGIFDIGIAQTPQLLKNFSPSALATGAYDVTKVGNLLYVANGAAGLTIVDVTSPSAPRVLANSNTSSASNDSAQKVVVDGAIAYIANGYAGVKLFDITDPTRPALIGQIRTAGYVVDVNVIGNYVYIADKTGISVIRAAHLTF